MNRLKLIKHQGCGRAIPKGVPSSLIDPGQSFARQDTPPDAYNKREESLLEKALRVQLDIIK